MKHLLSALCAVALLSATLSSCGNPIESDAKKVAKVVCDGQKKMTEAATKDPKKVMEIASELQKESAVLEKEMAAKYTTEEDKKAFEAAVQAELEKCK